LSYGADVPVNLGHEATTDLADPVLPAIYAAQLVQLTGRWGVDPQALMQGTGLSQAQLDEPQARVSRLLFSQLVERALAQTGEPGLGFYYGLQLKLSSHGVVGLAAMASATLGDAVAIAERFCALRAPYLGLRSTHEGERVALALKHEGFDPRHESLLVFLTEAVFTALVQMAHMLLGRTVSGAVELAYPEPPHFAGFAQLWPGPARFGRRESRLLFSDSLLTLPLQMADAVAARRALLECERELATLPETSSFLGSVRRQLGQRELGFPSLTELARERHVSPRTLKRRLVEQGSSYRLLLDEVRRDRALALLERGQDSVEQIAARLGYSDTANFNRAFRRWLGTSPSAWRAQQPEPS